MKKWITDEDLERFYSLRNRLFTLIAAALHEDPYCKSYEGAIDLDISFPNYFETDSAYDPPEYFGIELHCYILINGRHKKYKGKKFSQCLDSLEQDVNLWEMEWKEELKDLGESKK